VIPHGALSHSETLVNSPAAEAVKEIPHSARLGSAGQPISSADLHGLAAKAPKAVRVLNAMLGESWKNRVLGIRHRLVPLVVG
jgi:hypothetical protein